MKTCPSCEQTYSADAPDFCPRDGARLVSDAAAADLLQPTMLATPSRNNSAPLTPPAAPSYNQYQTGNQYQGGYNQAQPQQQWQQQQQPPPQPQWSQPAPSQSFSPQPFAQPFTTPSAAPKKSYVMPIAIGAIVLLLLLGGIGGLAAYLALRDRSLGEYKGSLSDLLPDKVEGYNRTKIETMKSDDVKAFKAKEGMTAFYDVAGDKIEVDALKYDSVSEAESAADTIKRNVTASLEAKGLKPDVSTDKRKLKGKYEVGTKYDMRFTQGGLSILVASMWNNGSVIFITVADLEKLKSDAKNHYFELPGFNYVYPY